MSRDGTQLLPEISKLLQPDNFEQFHTSLRLISLLHLIITSFVFLRRSAAVGRCLAQRQLDNMRLLDVSSPKSPRGVRFVEFPDSHLPKFVILSHTWIEKEITYQEFLSGLSDSTSFAEHLGFTKILNLMKVARDLRYRYVWVDTCKLDDCRQCKSSLM